MEKDQEKGKTRWRFCYGLGLFQPVLIFHYDSQPRNAVKANMNRENTHNGTASVMDWPSQSPDLNILLRPKSKVELWMSSKSPENYYWRLFKEIKRKLTKFVKMYKIFFAICSIFSCVSINLCTHFLYPQQNRKKWLAASWFCTILYVFKRNL